VFRIRLEVGVVSDQVGLIYIAKRQGRRDDAPALITETSAINRFNR
jgi:hypothetical protein